jgi:hypothetical protein
MKLHAGDWQFTPACGDKKIAAKTRILAEVSFFRRHTACEARGAAYLIPYAALRRATRRHLAKLAASINPRSVNLRWVLP